MKSLIVYLSSYPTAVSGGTKRWKLCKHECVDVLPRGKIGELWSNLMAKPLLTRFFSVSIFKVSHYVISLALAHISFSTRTHRHGGERRTGVKKPALCLCCSFDTWTPSTSLLRALFYSRAMGKRRRTDLERIQHPSAFQRGPMVVKATPEEFSSSSPDSPGISYSNFVLFNTSFYLLSLAMKDAETLAETDLVVWWNECKEGTERKL